MATNSPHMLDLARRGAEVRLRQLAREARNLMSMFPHLGDEFDPDELPVPFIIAEGARRSTGPATGGASNTPGARRAPGRKKSWADRRKSKARS